jgi:hypothetical protein
MRTALGVLLVLGVATPVMAGQIYGTIFHDKQPLREARVLLNCNGEGTDGPTDGDGVYRLFVRATGSCQLIVESQGRKVEATVYSYDRPTGYNFELTNRSGRWELVRR